MADLSITNVNTTTRSTPSSVQLGEAGAAFDLVYSDGNKVFKTDATDAAKTRASHILLQSGVTDEWVSAQPITGNLGLTLGLAMTQGEQYVVSANAGKVAPRSDLVSTNYIGYVWFAVDGNTARGNTADFGVTVP